MSTLTTRTHAFKHSVSVDEVEALLGSWPIDSDAEAETILDLSECRNIDTGAGIRLTNAMRRWASGRLTVSVAPGADLQSSEWFRLFTRSGLGASMGAHAHVVLSGDRDITEDIRSYYEATASSHATNCVMFRGIEDGALVPTQDRFIGIMLQAIREHLRQAYASLTPDDRRSLARFAHEAITNVVDHAFAAPWGEPGAPLSYLSIRWYRTVSARNDQLGGLHSYIAAHHEGSGPTNVIAGWMEIVVADDGVGIAARHAQTDESVMYSGATSDEDEALHDALESSATVKLRTLDAQLRGEPGFGTAIMADSLKTIKAYAALRTGRRLIEFDPWRHEQFELHDAEFGWLPGTAVQVLLPVLDRQLRLT